MEEQMDVQQSLDELESTLEKFVEYELKHVCTENPSEFLEKCIAPQPHIDYGSNEKIKRIDNLVSEVHALKAQLAEDPIGGVTGIILFYENLLVMCPYPEEKEKIEIACEKLKELRVMIKARRATPSPREK